MWVERIYKLFAVASGVAKQKAGGEKEETTSYAESPSFSAEKFPGGATVTLRHKLWGMLSVISTLPQNRR